MNKLYSFLIVSVALFFTSCAFNYNIISDKEENVDADQYSIINEPISSLDLMERASKAFVAAIENKLHPSDAIAVVCGPRNNGGDGLAIARVLSWKGFEVQPFLFLIRDQLSEDCEANSHKVDNLLTVSRDSEMPDFGNFDVISTLPDISKYSCVGIGPGIGQAKETKEALANLMNTAELPLVLDADALNIICADQTILALIPPQSVLTPHPKEFERLVGSWKHSLDRLEKQIAFSVQHKCIIVLKDADTIVTDSEGSAYFNTTGNPGLATGGSGDVLTGIITGLVAQGYSPLEAALIGVYYHGLAGDEAMIYRGMSALIASDIIEF